MLATVSTRSSSLSTRTGPPLHQARRPAVTTGRGSAGTPTVHSPRPGQARQPGRAVADLFGLVDLGCRGPGGPDRKEQVRIRVRAGGVVTPVRRFAHRMQSWHGSVSVQWHSIVHLSSDDAEGEPRGGSHGAQVGDVMPVEVVGVNLGQRPGDP